MKIFSNNSTEIPILLLSDSFHAYNLYHPSYIGRIPTADVEEVEVIVEVPAPPPSFPGAGTLSGTVMVNGSVVGSAIVSLFEDVSNYMVAETTSAIDGTFSFTGLSTTHSFYMVFKEPTGEWEYLVSSRRVPG